MSINSRTGGRISTSHVVYQGYVLMRLFSCMAMNKTCKPCMGVEAYMKTVTLIHIYGAKAFTPYMLAVVYMPMYLRSSIYDETWQ